MTVSVVWVVELSPVEAKALIVGVLCLQMKGETSIFYKVDSNSDKTFAIDYLEI